MNSTISSVWSYLLQHRDGGKANNIVSIVHTELKARDIVFLEVLRLYTSISLGFEESLKTRDAMRFRHPYKLLVTASLGTGNTTLLMGWITSSSSASHHYQPITTEVIFSAKCTHSGLVSLFNSQRNHVLPIS